MQRQFVSTTMDLHSIIGNRAVRVMVSKLFI